MKARSIILDKVRNSKPSFLPLDDIKYSSMVSRTDRDNWWSQFRALAETVGASVIRLDSQHDFQQFIDEYCEGQTLVNLYHHPDAPTFIPLDNTDLDLIRTAVMPAAFAVAENGALWLNEKQMGIRALPFICEHLVLVVNEGEIVANMHEAYERITGYLEGFGVFIAGPSKTADIEQSLVIGAHGPKSLTVVILGNGGSDPA